MPLLRWIVHFIAYYITWFVCIAYAVRYQPWLGTLIALSIIAIQVCFQMISHGAWRRELGFALGLMSLGIIVDTILMQTGWISFRPNPFAGYLSPPWMAALWLSFGFTITITSKAWLHRYVIWGVLTFISLPFAYWVGAIFGAATIENMWFYPILGGIWMVLLPYLLNLYGFKKG